MCHAVVRSEQEVKKKPDQDDKGSPKGCNVLVSSTSDNQPELRKESTHVSN
jgi:hypothetical protein